jgi:hypothetical protein
MDEQERAAALERIIEHLALIKERTDAINAELDAVLASYQEAE